MSPDSLRRALVAVLLLAPLGFLIAAGAYAAACAYAVFVLLAETACMLLVRTLRTRFQWLITPEDEHPTIAEAGLDKFMAHGFDPDLGWVRKPDTDGVEKGKWGATHFSIDSRGSRVSPGHEGLPTRISIYGDSFAFSRQVNDQETWAWHLSELTRTHVLNFAVGNYGFDQALLRLKREYPLNPTEIVIMGVVPSTIVRVLSLWKHYNEFGNTFAFKPMFRLKRGSLELVPNVIRSKQEFLSLERHLPYFRENDYFYESHFRRRQIRFPYLASVFAAPYRNVRLILLILWSMYFEREDVKQSQVYGTPMRVIMEDNLELRERLFEQDEYAVDLLDALVREFETCGRELGFRPVLLLMPQKDDVAPVRRAGKFYASFLDRVAKRLPTLDFMDRLLTVGEEELDDLYSDDNKYGGHYSKRGNELLAADVHAFLSEHRLLPRE